MSIGTAERPINIKDLVLEEPERQRELPFDPEKEITQEDWRMMIEVLKKNKSRENSQPMFHILAMNMALLLPDRIPDLPFTQEDFLRMKDELVHIRQGGVGSWVGRPFSDPHPIAIKTLSFLIYHQRIDVGPSPNRWSRSLQALDHLPPDDRNSIDHNPFGWAMNAAGVLILFPDRRNDLNLDEQVQRKLFAELEQSRQKEQWGDFLAFAMYLRFLFPERVLPILRQEDWVQIRDMLEKSRRFDRANIDRGESSLFFPDQALAAKVFSAEDVRITEDGQISITMRKPKTDFAPPTPPLPEVRRF